MFNDQYILPVDNRPGMWFTMSMTKTEAMAYLRKKVLLDKLADREIPMTNPEAAEELDNMEKTSEKDLTSEPSSV